MTRTMTVAQLSSYLRGVFEDEELLHDVTLTGEVAEVSYSDRHTYVTLADGVFSVRCVHFFSRDQITKGVKVALHGSVGYYDKRNTVSFNYKEFYTQGAGDKNAEFAAVKQRLAALGYFENRPQLPKYIVSVAAVTSADGAAIRDLIRVVSDKSPFVSVKVCPVRVQGEGAAAQMISAIKYLQKTPVDVIVLCRGGGSDEDLDTFNDEKLATAVALSGKPVISAVGHEVDYTLCDFCAGTRAGTPSIAGEIINACARRLTDELYGLAARAENALSLKYASRLRSVQRLGGMVTRAVSARVEKSRNSIRLRMDRGYYALKSRLAANENAVNRSAQLLSRGVHSRLTGAQLEIKRLSGMLSALDPHRIIKVGYAAVLHGGRRVTELRSLAVNDTVELVFADGTAKAKLTDVIPE